MKRRDLLKNIALTSVGVATAATGLNANTIQSEQVEDLAAGRKKKSKAGPGRTPEEVERDAKLMAETFFTQHEMATLAVLCDIILPADATSGSASQAGVPAFIEFMAKDTPHQQTPLRGGLMWLDNQAMKRFSKKFVACSPSERLQIVDDIAYPEQAKPAMKQGVSFFNLMRDLTMTGFYTTEMGFQDLGYIGNQPNVWQGVPEEVLKQYGLTGGE
ncbi:gluconate 2-dehydrogenase subunit 3 family protein [Haliscomenobacter hydrossis]|uniref:Tat pathway signal sequence domain-containing protein n=1 Tax=Haliscomenobacter hydrossis (strain ATCC 27775 / DSM 1100 / LMG 10767 / O) TaxID=760192 RepID=F4KRT5_HALH1|nr:gluconate 2-dehydrogenase subunit 3 family protein [Haliscomenobacter hydrossis]AEE50039.1 Tat pathway signal sequence domain-containing protein [Haliscomenobacter hydrossis DSM 1100]